MNFLAHFVLSHDQPEIAFGNFMTDMIKPAEQKEWPESLYPGIELHHFIDDFTDDHPVNKELRILLRPHFRKYAGVALDLYYDFILFRHWEKWGQYPFEEFREKQYRTIRTFFDYVPPRLRLRIVDMTAGDFLNTYTTLPGQAFAFQKMDERANFHTGFSEAIDVLPQVIDELDRGFQSFFPEIYEATREKIDYLMPGSRL